MNKRLEWLFRQNTRSNHGFNRESLSSGNHGKKLVYNNKENIGGSECKMRSRQLPRCGILSLVFLTVFIGWGDVGKVLASPIGPISRFTQVAVPILGVTLTKDRRAVGIVTTVLIHFWERDDHNGLQIEFDEKPGRFSPLAQQSVKQAITRASQAAHLQTDSWSVELTFPYDGLTVYGKSLSAMVGLSVIALAKGDPILQGRAITGTITKEGHIGKVGGVPLKIYAAYANHFQRVLVPEEQDLADGEWRTPFLMQVSPVGTIDKAYYGLTGHRLYTH
ncbi:MAG: hypothetical protein D6704_05815 [Nitrospirae bacterium]|nr:MAG: hypothetical protein D6704_05815 [Nitrospirota bacterium]